MIDGLIIDLFAGGGGASQGIEAALGRTVDIALNHDPIALAVHKANHPDTRHVTEDVWKANPADLVQGRPVGLLWASPDCKHFSMAKGGKPRDKKIRTLAWAVYRWARATRPAVIFLENVKEFQGWGPLTKQDRPDKRYIGKTFRCWLRRIERLGYAVEHRMLDASLYGAPTRRRRLFIVARRDGKPIVWPKFTHGPGGLPLRTAAECIDWSIPCPSIFERRRALADKTQWRIAQGVRRFVLDCPRPFIVPMNHSNAPLDVEQPLGVVTSQCNRFNVVAPHLIKVNHGKREARVRSLEEPLTTVTAGCRGGDALVAPTLIQMGYGEDLKRAGGAGQKARVFDLGQPLTTVVAQGRKRGLVSAFLAKHYGGVVGQQLDFQLGTITSKDHHSLTATHLVKLRGQCHSSAADAPMPTLSAQGTHVAEVRAFLVKYYGTARAGQSLELPLHTLTSKHRMGLVAVEGAQYQIADIGMRMLEPHELLRAQFGRFAASYDLSLARTKTAMIRLIGNSVCPEVAEALVTANIASAKTSKVAA
jgi:DNA (cytosine-5)-methyltransferase 1